MALSTLADGLCQKVAAIKKIRSHSIIFIGATICYHSYVPCTFLICKSLYINAPTEWSTPFSIWLYQPVRGSDCSKNINSTQVFDTRYMNIMLDCSL